MAYSQAEGDLLGLGLGLEPEILVMPDILAHSAIVLLVEIL